MTLVAVHGPAGAPGARRAATTGLPGAGGEPPARAGVPHAPSDLLDVEALEDLGEGHVGRRVVARGELALPTPEGRVAAADVATVAVGTLLADAPPRAPTMATGPAVLTGRQVAAALGRHLARPVRSVPVDAEEHLREVAESLGDQYAATIARLHGPGSRVPDPGPPPAGTTLVTGPTTLADQLPTRHRG